MLAGLPLLAAGWSITRVSAELGLTRESVQLWLERPEYLGMVRQQEALHLEGWRERTLALSDEAVRRLRDTLSDERHVVNRKDELALDALKAVGARILAAEHTKAAEVNVDARTQTVVLPEGLTAEQVAALADRAMERRNRNGEVADTV